MNDGKSKNLFINFNFYVMGPEMLIPLFAIVGTFASIIIFTYMYFSSRNRERMALIERDKDASIFASDGPKSTGSNSLKYGILAISIGLGIFLANYFERNAILDDEVAYFSLIPIMAGLGFLLYYFVISRIVATSKDASSEDDFA